MNNPIVHRESSLSWSGGEGAVDTAAGPAAPASACCDGSAAVPLSEPVGRVQKKSFGSEGFEKQCNRAEFKWVRGAPGVQMASHAAARYGVQ